MQTEGKLQTSPLAKWNGELYTPNENLAVTLPYAENTHNPGLKAVLFQNNIRAIEKTSLELDKPWDERTNISKDTKILAMLKLAGLYGALIDLSHETVDAGYKSPFQADFASQEKEVKELPPEEEDELRRLAVPQLGIEAFIIPKEPNQEWLTQAQNVLQSPAKNAFVFGRLRYILLDETPAGMYLVADSLYREALTYKTYDEAKKMYREYLTPQQKKIIEDKRRALFQSFPQTEEEKSKNYIIKKSVALGPPVVTALTIK